LKPGKTAENLCYGPDDGKICLDSLIPELGEGEHVVVLADLSSTAFGEAVKDLNAYSLSGKGPALWVLSAATPEEMHQFFWTRAPTFEIREAPRSLIRPWYRSLPRSFLVYDSKVTQTFSGLPPLESLARGKES
jgi:hypothetical protein